MFFSRNNRQPKVTFEDYVNRAHDAGFRASSHGAGRVRMERDGVAAVIVDGGDKPRVAERAGIVMGSEIGVLVDGGFQKFFQTPKGARRPALASELKATHAFEEDLRAALGLVTLYNESLGSVSNLYLYDRVKDRDTSRPKKPWELASRK